VEFVVIKEQLTPLLGLRAAQAMKLITVNEALMDRVAKVEITDEFADVFDGGLGKLPGSVSLKIDKNVEPVISPSRRIPVALRPKLKAELSRLVAIGVIEPVNEPTPWVNQIVLAEKKSGALRICLDPRDLNRALKREHYPLPILDDVLHNMGNSRVFSKLDLSSGYWHVDLDEDSSLLTTFQTCFGRYRWRRLPFGLSVSSEIFQKKLLQAIDCLPGVECIADDLVVHGPDVETHDRNLNTFLARCQEKGIKLNLEKLELRLSRISFMGHRITDQGLEIDPEKVRAIDGMPTPSNLEGLRRFLGLANYLCKFLPNLNSVTAPLRNLTKKDVPFVWSRTQSEAFDKVKDMVSKAPVLAMYDPSKDLTLENDASEYGVGSVLMQSDRPIAYASRSLTDTETRWAQIEKEMLAITYGLEKFHHYTYGRVVAVITDHKPLVPIMTKPLYKAPKRLQALLLRAQKYQFSLVHKPGTQLYVSDTLSRAPLAEKPSSELVTVNLLNFIPIKPDRLNQIKMATLQDENLSLLKDIIIKGWPNSKGSLPSESLIPYFHCRDEVTVHDGIVLRGNRVVIPHSMRTEMKELLHAGHLGINSCLRRARELIYWPRMSSEIRQHIEACSTCATFADKQPQETLFLHDVPSRPWEKIGTDIFTYDDRQYLVTADYYSTFFELDYLSDTLASTVVSKLKQHFARHGIPDVVISDGGPQYTSGEFQKFQQNWVFQHEFSSPGNSKANGAAEAAVKQAKRILRKSHHHKEDPYLGLLNLRNTPTEGVNTSPAQRLFSRRTKTLLPTTSNLLKPGTARSFESQKQLLENKRFNTANRKGHDLKPLNPGDSVRVEPTQRGTKEWRPAKVIKELKPRTYEIQLGNGNTVRRNRQHLRLKPHGEELPKDNTCMNTLILPKRVETTVPVNTPVITKPKASTTEQKPTAPLDSAKPPQPYVTRAGRVSVPPTKLSM
jgi:transposase InsO family protein